MNINEFSANIQYKNSFITECTITNNLLDIGEDAVLNANVKVAVSNPAVSEDQKEKIGRVRLTFDGNYSVPDNKDANCGYHIVLIGEFSTSVETKDEEFFTTLWLNGSTALYSIARGKIETISTAVLNNGKIVLPMVNMIELLKAQFEAEDKKRKEGIDARNEADSLVFQTQKALDEVGDKVDASEKEKVQADIDKLKELVEKSNPESMTDAEISDINAAKEALMQSAQNVFQKMYEGAQAAGGAAGPDMGAGAGPDMGANTSQDNADDVVDGDYREV